jgi:hypothetical protein
MRLSRVFGLCLLAVAVESSAPGHHARYSNHSRASWRATCLCAHHQGAWDIVLRRGGGCVGETEVEGEGGLDCTGPCLGRCASAWDINKCNVCSLSFPFGSVDNDGGALASFFGVPSGLIASDFQDCSGKKSVGNSYPSRRGPRLDHASIYVLCRERRATEWDVYARSLAIYVSTLIPSIVAPTNTCYVSVPQAQLLTPTLVLCSVRRLPFVIPQTIPFIVKIALWLLSPPAQRTRSASSPSIHPMILKKRYLCRL